MKEVIRSTCRKLEGGEEEEEGKEILRGLDLKFLTVVRR